MESEQVFDASSSKIQPASMSVRRNENLEKFLDASADDKESHSHMPKSKPSQKPMPDLADKSAIRYNKLSPSFENKQFVFDDNSSKLQAATMSIIRNEISDNAIDASDDESHMPHLNPSLITMSVLPDKSTKIYDQLSSSLENKQISQVSHDDRILHLDEDINAENSGIATPGLDNDFSIINLTDAIEYDEEEQKLNDKNGIEAEDFLQQTEGKEKSSHSISDPLDQNYLESIILQQRGDTDNQYGHHRQEHD
jgi:hypothetical protein